MDNKITNEVKNIYLPIYPTAKGVKEYFLENGSIRGVTYEVICRYPAEEILLYYEKELKRIGFKSFSGKQNKSGCRRWQTFVDSTKNNEPYIAQLTAEWTDLQKTIIAVLVLRYSWPNGNKLSRIVLSDNQKLKIVFQIMPYY